MKSTSEAANARAASGAVLGMQMEVNERALITGVFDAFVEGYKDVHKREYLGLFNHLQSMRAELDVEFRLPIKRMNMDRANRLIDDIEELEAYAKTLTERKSEGRAPNLVTTVGKNYLLDNGLAGSSFTAAFYLGLISSTSWSAVNAADTMSSHTGWLEAGNAHDPTYTGNRKTAGWSSASAGSKAFSAGLVFTAGSTGTVKGCFLTTVATVDGTTGTLYSAGTFTGGDQPVVSTNTLTVSYTASL